MHKPQVRRSKTNVLPILPRNHPIHCHLASSSGRAPKCVPFQEKNFKKILGRGTAPCHTLPLVGRETPQTTATHVVSVLNVNTAGLRVYAAVLGGAGRRAHPFVAPYITRCTTTFADRPQRRHAADRPQRCHAAGHPQRHVGARQRPHAA